MQRAEFVVLGAGALGSIVAAHLARAGHRVVVLARGERASVIRRDGLRIEGLVEISVPVDVISDAHESPPAATLIVATKAIGTAPALAQLAAARFDSAVSLQNGVQKDELVAAALGPERTLSAAPYISGELRPSGAVVFTRRLDIIVGTRTTRVAGRADQLARDLAASGLPARVAPDVERYIWSKFAAWVGFASLSVLTRQSTGAFLSNASAAEMFVRLAQDVERLASANGIALVDDPSLPIARICAAGAQTATRLVVEAGKAFLSTAPLHRVSSLQDLDGGRPLELDETIGHAVRMARTADVAVPTLDVVYQMLSAIEQLRQRTA